MFFSWSTSMAREGLMRRGKSRSLGASYLEKTMCATTTCPLSVSEHLPDAICTVWLPCKNRADQDTYVRGIRPVCQVLFFFVLACTTGTLVGFQNSNIALQSILEFIMSCSRSMPLPTVHLRVVNKTSVPSIWRNGLLRSCLSIFIKTLINHFK